MAREEFRECIGWDGATIVVPLSFITIETFEHFFGFECFHPLGYYLEAEVMSQVRNGPHNDCVIAILFHILHEGLVDLYACHRQLFQMGERRIPRSEIINGKCNSKISHEG